MNNSTNTNMAGAYEVSILYMNEIDQENLDRSYTGCDIFSCYSASLLDSSFGSSNHDAR